ncbi:MAG: hypothetical protein ACOZEN_10470 [Thermodesulfobacteriota bacterium]
MNTIRAVIILSLLLSSASPAAAQVTTLEQQIAIWDGLIQAARTDPAAVTSNLFSFLPSYGNYCGLQTTPAGANPFDCVDAACQAHDLSAAYTTPAPALEQVAQADRRFIGSLTVTQAATPYGELYRNLAIQLFETKTTYEQANRTTVYTGCSDCDPAP